MLSFCLGSLFVITSTFQPSEIDKLVKQLGSARFAEREAATKRLEAIGAPASAALRKAATSPDAEVRRRAETLLAGMKRRGIIADDGRATAQSPPKMNGQGRPGVARAPGQVAPKPALPLPPLPKGVSDKELASRWREAYASWQKDQRRAPEAIKIIQQVSDAYSERLPELATQSAVDETQAMLFATLEILDGKPKSLPPAQP